ncbi:MAG: hypothetical protein E7350_00420 [Clostridiales bacterium]|nr:hypothetical protein [Clostridiales bacterium]
MKIGIMDSGIGGITTLRRLMSVVGGDYVFVRDRLCPYGDKDDGFILSRTFAACEKLKQHGAELIVLACNTATSVAVRALREQDKAFSYIGIEPAVKPALLGCDKAAVILTPATARQDKFKLLIKSEGDRLKIVTPPALAPQIEKSFFDPKEMARLAAEVYSECKGYDGVVLGCTHYIFLKDYLYGLDYKLKIFDGNDGVARRVLSLVGKQGDPSVRFIEIG